MCLNDNYTLASAGVYCFRNYYTKEIYYIGLATDLNEIFKRHNGILLIDENAYKRKQIEKYFNSYEKLGHSTFIQSLLSQSITHRNKNQYEGFLSSQFSIEDYVGSEGKEYIKQAEDIFIEENMEIFHNGIE